MGTGTTKTCGVIFIVCGSEEGKGQFTVLSALSAGGEKERERGEGAESSEERRGNGAKTDPGSHHDMAAPMKG